MLSCYNFSIPCPKGKCNIQIDVDFMIFECLQKDGGIFIVVPSTFVSVSVCIARSMKMSSQARTSVTLLQCFRYFPFDIFHKIYISLEICLIIRNYNSIGRAGRRSGSKCRSRTPKAAIWRKNTARKSMRRYRRIRLFV